MSDEPTTGGPAGRPPLDGLLVVDLSRVLSGPLTAMLLGDLGARVIKVEHPRHGDDTRAWGPPFVGDADRHTSTYFLAFNRNKESITLDLKEPGDHAVLIELLRRADVVVENFRPGVMDSLGLSNERLQELNQRLVVVSITGFGPDGPEARRAGYDQIIQGEAGLMSVTGEPGQPIKAGIPVADIMAGLNATIGALAALVGRGGVGTGTGQVVSTSLLASIVSGLSFQATRWLIGHDLPEPSGNRHPTIAPYALYQCEDGPVQVAVGSRRLWEDFADIVGLDPDDALFATNADRMNNAEALDAVISEVFARKPADYWLEQLRQAGIPAGRIRPVDEVFTDPQVRSQGLLRSVEHEVFGTLELPGSALRFQNGCEPDWRPPPLLGEHSSRIRAWLDATAGEDRPPDQKHSGP